MKTRLDKIVGMPEKWDTETARNEDNKYYINGINKALTDTGSMMVEVDIDNLIEAIDNAESSFEEGCNWKRDVAVAIAEAIASKQIVRRVG